MIRTVSYFLIYSLSIAFLLTSCDYYCHTRLNVLYYHPTPDNPPFLSLFPNHPTSTIFMNFFGIGMYCVITSWMIFSSMKPLTNEHTIFTLFTFILFYYLSGLLQDSPMFLNNLFLTIWGIQLINFNSEFNKLLLYSIFLGVLGPVVEGYYSGVMKFFAYNDVDAYYVPCWLCGLYLNGALAIVAITIKLESWRIHRIDLKEK